MEHHVYIIFNLENVLNRILLADFHLTLVAQIPCLKLICFCVLRERSIDIFLFVEHFSIFNVQSVLILAC